MAHLSLNMLGEIRILIDEAPVSSFESDKVRALLAYLAVESDRPQRRETLIGLLWPECTEEAARHNLSQALFNLRLVIGDHTAHPPYLLISRNAIQFNRESDASLDVDQFNEYFRVWRQSAEREGQEDSRLIGLEDMVRLYRGEFLRGFSLPDSGPFEDWILVQRETMRQRTMDALAVLADECERLGDFQGARSHAARQLELDPWREEVHYQIMRLLALDGQRSAALAQYDTCKKVLAEELGVEPSAETRDLYEQIRLGKFKARELPPAGAPVAPVHNLPAAITPFFGRERELAQLDLLLDDPAIRCITLVGPGGIGKTRLALEAAGRRRHAYAQGSAFVALASVDRVETAIPAIATAIGFAFHGPSEPRQQLINHLRDKQMLLVVDNVEHLLAVEPRGASIAELLLEILQGAENVKLLVTSREAIDVQGEWPLQLEGLAFPETEIADAPGNYEAVALFLQRARRAHPELQMNAEDMTAVVRLCRLVEGMPLAIELAATWVRLLSPVEIAAEVERSLDFLKSRVRDLPERQQSMRTVFDYSWQALSAEEKQVLGKLSTFRGGFQRQAAEQVAAASLQVLSALLIRSLLRRASTGRYDLHELIRQYAASKLAEDPAELRSAQQQHSLYYLGLLEQRGVGLQGFHQKEAVAELTSEMDNIRAAWDWSIANHEFLRLHEVSPRLMHLCEVRNWFQEAEATFRKTAEALQAEGADALGPEADHRIALHALQAHWGFFRFRLGKGEEAYNTLATSAAFLRTSGGAFASVYAGMYLGIDCWTLGRFAEARESLEASLAVARAHGYVWHEAMDNEFLARLAIDQGDYSLARQYLREAADLLNELGDPSMRAHSLCYLGRTLESLGEYQEAERVLKESLVLSREVGYLMAVALALDGLGKVAYAEGRHETARPLFSESAALFREMGDKYRLSRTLSHEGLNLLALGEARGARSDFQAALKLACEGHWTPTVLYALAGLAGLEAREAGSPDGLALVYCILGHPASAQDTKDIAARLKAELESGLTQDEIDAAHRRGSSKSLDDFVGRVLASA